MFVACEILFIEELEGHRSLELGILRLPHNAHATFADLLDKAVVR